MKINAYLFAVLMVVVVAALQIWSLHVLGSSLAWLTFYPAVMMVAIYGGFWAGLLATGLVCFIVAYLWPLWAVTPFINSSNDWLGLAIFAATGSLVSGVAEAMRQRCKQTQAIAASFKDSETRLRALFDNSSISIVVINEQGLIEEFNPTSVAIFAYAKEEVIGQNVNMLMPEPYRSEHDNCLKNYLAGGVAKIIDMEREVVGKRKGGEVFPMQLNVSEVQQGKQRIFVGFIQDISKRKQMDAELYTAKQVAEAANRSKSEFLANMSHEIRTPMNAIIGLTRLATETELTPKQQSYLQKIQSSSQALLAILNDILDLSKIESGRMGIERIEFDPSLMLKGVYDLYIARAEEKGLGIFIDVAPEIPQTVIGDPLRIQQVLANLISNAIKFTPNGEIYVRMEIKESSGNDLLLRLSVRDTGIGMNEAAIALLFQPFIQTDASTTRKFGGTGLGLAISKQLAELMGGDISVSSQVGLGSTFSFTVSCEKGQPYNWDQDSHQLKDARVLVVDDQETSLVILKNILESWRFQVVTALSATEALQYIQQAEQNGMPFDLLLVDWQMEGMSGLEFALELRRKESQVQLNRQPAIIMVTAYNKEQLLKEAIDISARFDAILTKPVLPSSLLNTILHVSRYQAREQAAVDVQADPYQAASPLCNARILLVEDNELNQEVAGEFLRKAGLRVNIANHGGEAVLWVQREKFDAVLMDLQMPEMDGYEATRRIRELPDCKDLPIIAMTAAAMQHDREACLAGGMNDHVAKPINPQELIDTLLRWIQPSDDQSMALVAPPAVSPETWADLANELQGFELNDVMMMLSGDRGQLLRMLGAFREQFIGEALAIAAQIAEGDFAAAKKRLHTLKGAAGNLGARDLHQASILLDTQLTNNHCEGALLIYWQKIFDKTLAAIAALLSRQAALALPFSDGATLKQVIAELDGLLTEDSFIGDDQLARLKSLLANDKQAEYNLLRQYILDTDYVHARALLQTLN